MKAVMREYTVNVWEQGIVIKKDYRGIENCMTSSIEKRKPI